jgi:serine/threonine protein kinase
MRLTTLLALAGHSICVKQGEHGYEGFPTPGETVIPIGGELYKIKDFLGAGPKKRAYRAQRIKSNDTLRSQVYTVPKEPGALYRGHALPDELVVKCSATDQPKRKNKLESEYKSLLFLNELRSVRKPIGLYLSRQWKCFDDSEFVCQYMAMTMASLDLQKIIGRHDADLKAPIIDRVAPKRRDGKYSFELFMASFALSLIAELEKLHAVGLVHRDISFKNVALDPSDRSQVFLIDMGSSGFLLNYSLEKVERLVKRDFLRVRRITMQLIEQGVMNAYPEETDPATNELHMALENTETKWEIRMALLRFLKEKFPNVRYDGRVIYH